MDVFLFMLLSFVSIEGDKCRIDFEGVDEFTGEYTIRMKTSTLSGAYTMAAAKEGDRYIIYMEVGATFEWSTISGSTWYFKFKDGQVIQLSPGADAKSKQVSRYSHTAQLYFDIDPEVIRSIKGKKLEKIKPSFEGCLLYTSPSPRDRTRSRMPSSA